MATFSDDDLPQCPLCHIILRSQNELQLHYLQSCAGYDNTEASDLMRVGSWHAAGPPAVQVQFVWFPSIPLKFQGSKVTLQCSVFRNCNSLKLFKNDNNSFITFSSTTVNAGPGQCSDGQIVCGKEILQIEPFEVSADSKEVYLITKHGDQLGAYHEAEAKQSAAESYEYLAEAKKNGMIIKFRHIKILLTGPPAAGKSSFFNLLFNTMFSNEYSSTDIMNTKQGVLSVKSYSQLRKDNETVWLEFDPGHQKQQLKSLLMSHSFSVSSQMPSLVKRLNIDKMPENQTKVDKSIVESPALPDGLETGDTVNLVSVFDTGGQPEYIALLPAINSVPTINFVVHDLTKKLLDPVLIRYKRADCKETPSYMLNYSNLEIIQLLICLITDSLEQRIVQLPECIEIPEQSYIGFIGTHYDKVKNDQEALQKVNEHLAGLINERNSLRVLSPGNSIIFPVDNTTAGDPEREDPMIKIVRDQIGELINEMKPKELPITWMILQVALQELHGNKYITYEQYRTMARDDALITDEMEIKASLSYFHILGVVLYFGIAELHNYIITDLKWLFTSLGRIMHLTTKEIKGLDYHLMEKFKKQRLLAKRLLGKMDLGDINIDEINYLFKILVHLKIVATVIIDEVEYYYLPCGLSSTIQYTDRCRFPLSEPLLVQFSSGFLPRGFFSSLVVYLLEELPQKWTPQFCCNIKHFNNVMTFLLPDETFLRLHDHTYYLEVSIRHFKRDVKCPYHHNVLPILKDFLCRVCSQLNFDSHKLQYGFLCHGDYESDDHIVIFESSKVSLHSQLKCRQNPSHVTLIGESHTAWFINKSTDLSSAPPSDAAQNKVSTILPPQSKPGSMPTLSLQNKKPEMGELNKIVVSKVMAHWNEVAYALHYDINFVKSLRETGQSPKKCCQRLFEDWLSSSNGASPKTYLTLFNVLHEVEELAGVVEDIVKEVAKL